MTPLPRILRIPVMIALLAVSSSGTHGPSAAADTLTDQIRPLAEAYLKRAETPCVVIGLIHSGHTRVFGFGRLTKGSDRGPDGSTPFEIGSVTKVFTGLALAEMAERGQVRLDEPVSALLPDSVKVPDRGGKPITLLDLSTHRSGLPRIAPITFLKGMFSANPYADFSSAQLYAFLKSFELESDPGATFAYSNLGYGLLGHALATRAGVDYETLIETRITRPLGMHSTKTRLDAGEMSRMAMPHDRTRKPIAPWDFDVLAGAGALRSSVDDLLRFLEAHLDPDSTPLASPIRAAMTPRRETGRPGDRIGLGWMVRTSPKTRRTLIWHNGGTGGSRSFIGLLPEQRIGIAVLANSDAQVDSLASEILRAIAPESTNQEPMGPQP